MRFPSGLKSTAHRRELLFGIQLVLMLAAVTPPAADLREAPPVPIPGTKLWQVQYHIYPVSLPPMIGVDGTVLVTAVDGLVALDSASGAERWHFFIPGGCATPPALGIDGTVQVASGDTWYALDAITGAKRREFAAGGQVVSAPAIGSDGTLYFGCRTQTATTRTGFIRAVDGATGARRWDFDTHSETPSSPAIGNEGTVYVGAQVFGAGSWSTQLYAVDGQTGILRWKFVLPYVARFSEPIIGLDRTVYVGCPEGGKVFALDGITGQKRWEFAGGEQGYGTPAIGIDGTVYVGAAAGSTGLYALDGATGTKRWHFALDSSASFSVPTVAADGTVYVGGSYRLLALNGTTGAKVWEFATEDDEMGPPAIGMDGTVFVTGFYGPVYAVRGSGGLAQSSWPKSRGDAWNSGNRHIAGSGPPTLRLQPRDQLVAVGGTVSFTAAVSGAPPLSFQWWKGDSLLPGAAQAAWAMTNVQFTQSGGYCLVVQNALGSVTSAVAQVTVGYPLALSTRDEGTVRADPTLPAYPPGQVVKLTAIPGPDRTFVGWHGDASGSANPLRIVMDAGKTIEAQFSPGPGTKLWEFRTGGEVRSCPAIGADGTVYIGSLDGNLYALNGVTGTLRWQFKLAGPVYGSAAIGAEETVFVTASDSPYLNTLHALDSATGSTRWTRRGISLGTGPGLGSDGTAYVGGEGRVHALDGLTGAVRWAATLFNVGDAGCTSPIVGADGTVYVHSSWSFQTVGDATTWAIDGATGIRRLEFQPAAGAGWARSPAIGEDGTIIAATLQSVRALDGRMGTTRWDIQGEGSPSGAPSVGPDGTVYVGLSRTIYAVDGAGGVQRWAFLTGSYVESTPAIAADGTVYVGSDDRKLYALDGATGAKRWEFLTGGAVISSPAVGADGTVYVGSADTKVYALRGTAGLARSPWPKYRGDAQNTGSRIPPVNGPPQIVSQPRGVRVLEGATYLLSLAAKGTVPLSYRWHRDGQPLTDVVGAGFQVARARVEDAGGYFAVVTNPLGSVTSAVAQVVVGYPLVVTPIGSGTIRVDPLLVVYEPGQVVELRAVPGEGQTFRDWLGDASGSANPTRLVMDGPKSVRARFSAAPGTKMWEFTGGTSQLHFAPDPRKACHPALGADGTVYAGVWDAAGTSRVVCALDGETGVARWISTVGMSPGSAPAVGADGTVYVGGNGVFAVDPVTGIKRWEFALGTSQASSPALGLDGTVYAGALGNPLKVVALDPVTGRPLWEYLLTGATGVLGPPAVGEDGTVFVCESGGGRLYALDGATGAKRWEAAPGFDPGSLAIGAEGTIYAARGTRHQAIDGTTGTVAWEWTMVRQGTLGRPVIGHDGTVYVGGLRFGPSAVLSLHALDGTKGTQRWEAWSGWRMYSFSGSAIAADGTLYVGTLDVQNTAPEVFAGRNGLLHAFDSGTGLLNWTRATGSVGPATGLTIGENGIVYLVAENQTEMAGGTHLMGWGKLETRVLAIQGNAGLARSPWPQLRGDARNSGRMTAPAKAPPRITTEPQGLRIRSGATAQFTVNASGTLPHAYQWHHGTQPIPGADNARLVLSQVQPGQAGTYFVEISNAWGAVTSQVVMLTVIVPRTLAVRFAPDGPIAVEWLEGALQKGASILGPWVTIPGAVAPWTTSPNESQQFYRLDLTQEVPVNPDPQRLVWIPSGTFLMGSPTSEPDRDADDEGPQTRVTLSRGFWLGKYEVKQSEYEALMGSNPSHFTSDAERPVESVSWDDAKNYCERLTAQERNAGRLPAGHEYRLPTEAQWEYACRAGTTTATAFGKSLSSIQANFRGDLPYNGGAQGPSLQRTARVGSYPPNAWGLHDLHGNVWEWCHDWYGQYPGANATDPTGAAFGGLRLLRGGGWDSWGWGCRSARRIAYLQTSRYEHLGFRVALVPVP